MSGTELAVSASRIQPDLVELRRQLHQDPEIGLELPRTQARILAALDGLPLEITLGEKLSSVTAVLRGGRPGPSVLLRADMDALPVQESTGLPFASRNPGVMHACGHDLHVAGLVGAARLLAERRAELAGNVVLMFQPGRRARAVPNSWSTKACWMRRGTAWWRPTRCTSEPLCCRPGWWRPVRAR